MRYGYLRPRKDECGLVLKLSQQRIPVLKYQSRRDRAIGVFDSGLGGLTVVREIRKKLPHEKIVYFGDIARLPYGIKSTDQIREFSAQNTEFLLKQGIKALVIACNSSSSAAFRYLKKNYPIPIVDVIEPAADLAAQTTVNKRVGIIGTQATIASGAYERALKSKLQGVKVYSNACPLLVSLVEEGILNEKLTEIALARYLNGMVGRGIDTLVLGCTHYPLLSKAIRRVAGKKVRLIDSAPPAVERLTRILKAGNLLADASQAGSLRIFVSDLPRNFILIGARFLGMPLRGVRVARYRDELIRKGKWVS